ncbi:MAG: hypothetical protein ABI467_01205 [Kofleriaceae bacterium]
MKNVLFLAALLFGCHHKQADTTESTGPLVDNTEHPTSGGDIIPPEKMDEVQNDLGRRQMIISRCLATAMENGEVPHGTHGHITFEIRIGTGGAAESVKVVKTDLQAKSVLECATKYVQDTAFPRLSRSFETSYEYAMEAN